MTRSVQISLILSLFCSLATDHVSAQQVLKVKIDQLPATHPHASVYLTGNFNGWEPADERMRLKPGADGKLGVTVLLEDIPGDRLEYKFTRGSWQSSECTAQGRLTGPRIADLGQDKEEVVRIEGWRDDFPESTASPNVHVLDSAFYMPQLDRHRRIWIYLPEDYAESDKRYPVLYMQDGQHLFDEATSQGRIGPIEWGVDETIDQAKQKCIVVAINHRRDYADREPEFYFHPNSRHPEVEGPAYLAFIVETLKPYIDERFRTLATNEYTAIAGSSLGGLISFYAGLHYPETFGIVGIFSPSFWMDEGNLLADLRRLALRSAGNPRSPISAQKYYFYAGSQETRRKEDGTFVRMEEDIEQAIEQLHRLGPSAIMHVTNPYGRHGALYWREAFPAFYEWFNGLTKNRIDINELTKKHENT